MNTQALHDLANRWDAPDARFAVLEARERAVLQQCARELRAALAEQREASTEPPSAQGAIISALATLVRASHDVDELDDGVREIWRELAVEARREYDKLQAADERIAELEREREAGERELRERDRVTEALAMLGEAAVEWDAAPLAETNRVTFALIEAVKAYARARKGER